MKQSKFVLGLGLCAMFYGCSTAKVRVLPGENSNHVVVTDFERDGAEEAAAKAASDYCEICGKELDYISDAGAVGYVMTSNRDYETSLEFKCR